MSRTIFKLNQELIIEFADFNNIEFRTAKEWLIEYAREQQFYELLNKSSSCQETKAAIMIVAEERFKKLRTGFWYTYEFPEHWNEGE